MTMAATETAVTCPCLLKSLLQAPRKSQKLVNKCSEALKMNDSHHENSFISSAADLGNSIWRKGPRRRSKQPIFPAFSHQRYPASLLRLRKQLDFKSCENVL